MRNVRTTIVLAVGAASILGGTFASAAPADKVTICHATESATNPFVTIHVSENAINGHFLNKGTPLAGHEDDILFEGEVECPTGENGGGTPGNSVFNGTLTGTVTASSSATSTPNNPTGTSTPQSGTLTGTVTASSTGTLTGTVANNTLTGTVVDTTSSGNNSGGGGGGGGGGRGGGGGNDDDDDDDNGGGGGGGVGGGEDLGEVLGASTDVPNTGAGGASTQTILTLILSTLVTLSSFGWLLRPRLGV